MADKLPDSLTFSNPRQRAEFDDWPSGKNRVKCRFYVEHDAKRGYRICRETQDAIGKWCQPKRRTYGGNLAIVDGSDGKTYILQQAKVYGFISVIRHDFLDAFNAVFQRDNSRFPELMQVIERATVMALNANYRFGQRVLTLDEIKFVAFCHGQDGICFYPPSRWVKDDHEPSYRHPADDLYRQEYERGNQSWRDFWGK